MKKKSTIPLIHPIWYPQTSILKGFGWETSFHGRRGQVDGDEVAEGVAGRDIQHGQKKICSFDYKNTSNLPTIM